MLKRPGFEPPDPPRAILRAEPGASPEHHGPASHSHSLTRVPLSGLGAKSINGVAPKKPKVAVALAWRLTQGLSLSWPAG